MTDDDTPVASEGPAPARPGRSEGSDGGPGAGRSGREAGPEGSAGPASYSGPGAWGTSAVVLLATLFVIAAAATAHSILVTFG